MEELGILVEVLDALVIISSVHKKVTAKVTRKEADEDETSDGHYEFFADGGTPKLA